MTPMTISRGAWAWTEPTNAYLGKDELDWPAIMTAAEAKGGIEWYIIEYEKEGVPPLEALKANLDAFKKLRS